MADGFKRIKRCQPGDVSLVSAEYANMLIDIINAFGDGTIAPVANVGKMALSGGRFVLDLTTLDGRLNALEKRVQTGGGGSNNVVANITPPLWVERVDNSNVRVSNGTVNGLIPSGVGLNINVSSTNANWAIYLGATIANNGAVTAANVFSSNNNVVPSDSPFVSYRYLALVNVSGGIVNTVSPMLGWSQTFKACDRNTTDPNTARGEYSWVVA